MMAITTEQCRETVLRVARHDASALPGDASMSGEYCGSGMTITYERVGLCAWYWYFDPQDIGDGFIGWKLAEPGESIPASVVMLKSSFRVTERERRYAAKLARPSHK